jgi:hypothetical protein
MPVYIFSPGKNLTLIKERNISFEEVIAAIGNDQILDIVDHPNQKKYGNQKIYIIRAKEYVYLVPFIIDKNGNIFLKTIIPSRKAKQKYTQKEL